MKLTGYGGKVLAQLPCGGLSDACAAAALSASALGGATLSACVDRGNIDVSFLLLNALSCSGASIIHACLSLHECVP